MCPKKGRFSGKKAVYNQQNENSKKGNVHKLSSFFLYALTDHILCAIMVAVIL